MLDWTPFVHVGTTLGRAVHRNARYEVIVVEPPPGEQHMHVMVFPLDHARPANHWADMQRIKNELVGPEAEAVELYPAESRLVNVANVYHLWVLPAGRFPFGFRKRCVRE